MAWLQEAFMAIEGLLANQTGGDWAKTRGGARQVGHANGVVCTGRRPAYVYGGRPACTAIAV